MWEEGKGWGCLPSTVPWSHQSYSPDLIKTHSHIHVHTHTHTLFPFCLCSPGWPPTLLVAENDLNCRLPLSASYMLRFQWIPPQLPQSFLPGQDASCSLETVAILFSENHVPLLSTELCCLLWNVHTLHSQFLLLPSPPHWLWEQG